MKGNYMFENIKARAQSEIDALKADARSVEERIEEAFKLGAMHHALDAIIADATSVEEKVKAAFDLGSKS
jgi:hypothetical protein